MDEGIIIRDKWHIFINFFGLDNASNFMYMGDCGDISLFKHKVTRQYLNIDKYGLLYAYTGQDYDYRLLLEKEAVSVLHSHIEDLEFAKKFVKQHYSKFYWADSQYSEVNRKADTTLLLIKKC